MDILRKISAFKEEFNTVCHKASRNSTSIQILYATKYLNGNHLISFIDIMKQIDSKKLIIGENRVQDWEGKYLFIKESRPDLLNKIYPVMIGSLQTNKINRALSIFEEIHSVDSLGLAQEINTRVKGAPLPIYIEVNVSREESKHGFRIEEIERVMNTMLQFSNVTIKGLMTMAPYSGNLEDIRGIYRKLKELANRYNLLTSMGMSNDWKIAIEEGSDMIRIGSAIFN